MDIISPILLPERQYEPARTKRSYPLDEPDAVEALAMLRGTTSPNRSDSENEGTKSSTSSASSGTQVHNDLAVSASETAKTPSSSGASLKRDYTHIITRTDDEANPGPSQASLDCWAGEVFPKSNFGKSPQDDQTWTRLLRKLGLTPDEFPSIKVEGRLKQPGTKKKLASEAPQWHYIMYTLIAVSPQGRLKQKTLYNLCLAWSSKLKPNNSSCRHSLCTTIQFCEDPDLFNSGSGDWHRLACPDDIRRSGPRTEANPKRKRSSPSTAQKEIVNVPTPEERDDGEPAAKRMKDSYPRVTLPKMTTDSSVKTGTDGKRALNPCSAIRNAPTTTTTATLAAASTSQVDIDLINKKRLECLEPTEKYLDWWLRDGRGMKKELFGHWRAQDLYAQIHAECEYLRIELHGKMPGREIATATQAPPVVRKARTPLPS